MANVEFELFLDGLHNIYTSFLHKKWASNRRSMEAKSRHVYADYLIFKDRTQNIDCGMYCWYQMFSISLALVSLPYEVALITDCYGSLFIILEEKLSDDTGQKSSPNRDFSTAT